VSAPVDVLAVMGAFLMFGGTIGPREVIPHWNVPRSTGLIANRANEKTPKVLRALQRAERDGVVVCVGTGAEHNRAWNKSAAATAERYWKLTDAALARVTGEQA
jgi:hypothetical protein